MARTSFTVEQTLTILAATPARIADLTAGLSAARLRRRPKPDEWSANEVLAHLRACADVWGGCIHTILVEDRPVLRAVNPRSWIEGTDYPELEFQASLRAFTRQRAKLLAVLEPLPREDWSRSATVTGAGKPLEWTVLSYAQRLARHERTHIQQIASLANALRRP